MSFDGFISYSHAADGRLAPAVQRGLHRLAKPWHRRRALWIFRDQTGLAVTPHLWTSIQKALDSSDYFVLLASPEAARSPWVNREVEHWVATKSAEKILPVVTDGEWRWDPRAKDFDTASTAVPPALRGVFAEEPLYLDLRWARGEQQINLRHSRFRDAIAQLAAPMHGVSKDDLEGEDVRQHRRAGRLRMAALTSLVVLATLASASGMAAIRNAAEANASAVEARKQEQEATVQRGSATKFAGEAQRQQDFARSQEARAQQAAADAARQERSARVQKGLAQRASAEVKVQLAKAGQAAARARQQQRLAERQGALARESAREMRRQQERAKEQERIAREQQKLAGEAGAEAAQQKKIADEQQRLAAEAGELARKQEQIAKEQEQRAKAAGDEAARQQRISVSRRLINEAKAAIGDDPRTALKLGVAAQSVYPEAETRREVAGLLTSTRYAGSIGEVTAAAYARGTLMAAINSDGTTSLWDAADRADPRRLATVGDPGGQNNGLALSRDGASLALVSDGATSLWDVRDPARPVRVATLPARVRDWSAVAFSPDGRTLVTGDRTAEGAYASLWDVTDLSRPEQLSTLTGGRQFSGVDFEFSPDSRTLVVAHLENVVWDISDRRNPVKRLSLPGPDLSYGLLAYSPTEPVLAVGASGQMTYFDMRNPGEPARIATIATDLEGISALGFNADGRLLAAGDGLGTTVVWELDVLDPATTYSPRQITRVSGHSGVRSVSFSADSRSLATADYAERALFYSVAEFAAPRRVSDVVGHTDKVRALSYAPDGRSLVTVGGDGNAAFWSASAEGELDMGTVAVVHRGRPVDVAAISPDGRTVVAGEYNGSLTMTDVSDPAAPAIFGTMTLPHSLSGLTFGPDGHTLAIAGGDEVQLWNLADHQGPRRTGTLTFSVSRLVTVGPVVFSPDGNTLAVVNNQKVTLWNVAGSGRPAQLSTLTGHGSVVHTLAFSPDGRTVATGSSDRSAILWDVTDRTRPHRLTILSGQSNPVTAVTFSRDGRTLVTGGGEESWATVWDVARIGSPVRLSKIRLDDMRTVGSMAFLPGSGRLLIMTDYGWAATHAEMWDVGELTALRADPIRLSCAIGQGGLTADEWSLYIPEMPYQGSCR